MGAVRDAGIKAERRLEIGEGRQRYIVPLAVSHELDGRLGGLAIFCDKRLRPAHIGAWQVLRVAPTTITATPALVIARVRTLLEALA